MNIVWFNGPSAAQFHHIPAQACEIGCNFIQRVRAVHHVCAFDPQVIAAVDSQVSTAQYWTRPSLGSANWTTPDSTLSAYCSGTLALTLADALGLGHVHVLGCDWGVTNASLFDAAYTWRQTTPAKNNRYKIQLLERLSTRLKITIVADEYRDLIIGNQIQWQDPAAFKLLL